ncbi:MAG TPA: sulfatase-like hydrolase/transferase [Pirellulales bacterium]|jgi:arylsulfatase A-like enzyme|nr:sulfatase-like hydrolase/transferase [Pirellulales bacterium]
MKLAIPLSLILLFFAAAGPAAAEPSKPNLIFVLADDLGIDGVSCYGADKHQTPHIDALAESGLRFRTCYASPLCGPSRCLLMTGRYAYHTGGLTNESWRAGGPGAKSADEYPMARLLKQAGYATGQAGKWRQVGEAPSDWGFDEYLTDNTANGWYWETRYNKNGQALNLPEGTYGPDVIQDFTFDFLRRHKDKPFFFYYAMHLVHKPTLRTPDTAQGTKNIDKLYDDNIRYMDKQLGALVAELEKLGLRQNTLVIFSGDNGTAAGYPAPVQGRMVNGWKGSMLEGGSRVPLIASWPAVTPKGKVLDDIISFADPYATFAELAEVKPPAGFKTDGQSFAAQLRGAAGTPRAWAFVQLGAHWYVREPGFKLNEAGKFFDMSDAPFVEKPVDPASGNEQSKAARQRLSAVLAELNPAAGKTDRENDGPRRNNRVAVSGSASAVGPWKSGDSLPSAEAPSIGGKALEVSAEIEAEGTEGVIVSQGGPARGYAIYLTKGKLAFAVRQGTELTAINAKDPLGNGHFVIQAALRQDGAMTISVDGKQVAEGMANGLIRQQPGAGLTVGSSGKAAVGEYTAPNPFEGKVTNVRVKATAAAKEK